ncbi:MAG: sigma-54-dependent Fis family transcriptional regulator [Deltaproteobacteria bacterium]|nr:sigma-54-dependent Fis family transcriptional regulator [Deltaproteobacteria bacterium]
MTGNIIVIDDDLDFLEILKIKLTETGYKNIVLEDDPVKAALIFEQDEIFDIALIDMTMPGMDGIKLLEIIKNTSPNTECIMITAVNEARTAVECLKKGAYDYLVKPVSKDDLFSAINRSMERKRLLDILDIEKKKTLPKLINVKAFKPIITRSHKVLKILKEAELHALSDVPVLITGESGTGKELLAKAIHIVSARSKFPFTPINMASIAGNLFDAEFFGHTKGAFTGADKKRSGHLEYTNQGTLFLDEIGNLSTELQGKLLRVLQSEEYIKLGNSVQQKVDIRFIAATNEDLDRLMDKKMFRKDLYYRLRGGVLHLPPLRDRKNDIPLLINQFLKEFSGNSGSCFIEEEALSLFMDYNYPGNIRELRAIIQSTVNLAQGKNITANFLPKQMRIKKTKKIIQNKQHQKELNTIVPLADIEKSYILKIYNQTRRNKSQTARFLDIGINTLRRKLKIYGE